MKSAVKAIQEPFLLENGFSLEEDHGLDHTAGQTYRLDPQRGSGYYWVYPHENLFAFTVHDFAFYEDFFLSCSLPEHLILTYFESVSGERLDPYKRLTAGYMEGCLLSHEGYRAFIHKNIPIRSIGIEIMPEYYEGYLKEKYREEYTNPQSAFLSIDGTIDFPELILLLHQVKNYRGEGMAAKLFYEGKAAEAISLIVERTKYLRPKNTHSISEEDMKRLETVTAYINDHFAFDLRLEQLAKIACMGTTKLKSTFKEAHKCTVTEYIQQRRMGQAEHLLSHTDLSIGQISQIVGYHSPSRFSKLFRKSTGLSPYEYRKLCLTPWASKPPADGLRPEP
ncbi:MAG: AraC family transcriptional regulator [Clostridiaceae bacterium]|nr:AraC family transcriptional regulator [Clostridiaceae bacterium]